MSQSLATSFFVTALALLDAVSPKAFSAYEMLRAQSQFEVRGIYWTAYTAGYENRRKQLIRLVENSELNAVVIDVKDASGKVFFDTKSPLVKEVGSEDLERMPDIEETLQELRQKNIYTIARIVVFQDPILTEKFPEVALKSKNGGIWKNWRGIAWADTSSKFVWKYNVEIAKEAIRLGFDEVNFDYIRFPSDGPLGDIIYPYYSEQKAGKNEVVADFFKYVRANLKYYPAFVSVDLFGMTMLRGDGLSIGQRYQDAADYVDYISPMVYPSHYPDGFRGYDNPADYPYEIVYTSLDNARHFLKNRRAKIRPWLQDFDLGAIYDTEKIHAQQRATDDAGGVGWMMWNASNNYTEIAYK